MKKEIEYDYVYFVSFAHRGGFGDVIINFPCFITENIHIVMARKHLEEEGVINPSVLNFKLLSMKEKNETET